MNNCFMSLKFAIQQCTCACSPAHQEIEEKWAKRQNATKQTNKTFFPPFSTKVSDPSSLFLFFPFIS